MYLRNYHSEDCGEIMMLFRNTVHHVNIKDYTPKQLDAWAPDQLDREQWGRSLQEHYTVVAVEKHEIVGFGDIDSTGYLDRLFVHYLHQRFYYNRRFDYSETFFRESRLSSYQAADSCTELRFTEKLCYGKSIMHFQFVEKCRHPSAVAFFLKSMIIMQPLLFCHTNRPCDLRFIGFRRMNRSINPVRHTVPPVPGA